MLPRHTDTLDPPCQHSSRSTPAKDNVHSHVASISLVEPPAQSLLHTVEKVYSPLLLRGEDGEILNPSLQSLLSQVRGGGRGVREEQMPASPHVTCTAPPIAGEWAR